MIPVFLFNNSDVGDITQYVQKRYWNGKKLCKVDLNIQNDITLNLIKYKNCFPLIINEVKYFLNIYKTRYNIVTIDNDKFLAYQNLNQVPLKDYLKTNKIKYMDLITLQKIFAFNWLMCINQNFENKIFLNPGCDVYKFTDIRFAETIFFETVNEKSFRFEIIEQYPSVQVLDEWFDGSVETFLEIAKTIVKPINPTLFKIELLKLVRKYDDNYVSWVNCVYQRISNLKNGI